MSRGWTRVESDTDTCNYTGLCDIFKLIAVSACECPCPYPCFIMQTFILRENTGKCDGSFDVVVADASITVAL